MITYTQRYANRVLTFPPLTSLKRNLQCGQANSENTDVFFATMAIVGTTDLLGLRWSPTPRRLESTLFFACSQASSDLHGDFDFLGARNSCFWENYLGVHTKVPTLGESRGIHDES